MQQMEHKAAILVFCFAPVIPDSGLKVKLCLSFEPHTHKHTHTSAHIQQETAVCVKTVGGGTGQERGGGRDGGITDVHFNTLNRTRLCRTTITLYSSSNCSFCGGGAGSPT